MLRVQDVQIEQQQGAWKRKSCPGCYVIGLLINIGCWPQRPNGYKSIADVFRDIKLTTVKH